MGKEVRGWGIASLVLGILGLVFLIMPYFSIILSILAIIFYKIQKKHEPTNLATAGLIMGIIGVVISIVILIVILFLFMTWEDSSNYEYVSPYYTASEITENVEVTDLICEYSESEYSDYSGVDVRGRIKNIGNKEAKSIMINIDLYNNGKWVDSSYAYPRNDYLAIGGIDSFDDYIYSDVTFTDCEAFVTYDSYYDYGYY